MLQKSTSPDEFPYMLVVCEVVRCLHTPSDHSAPLGHLAQMRNFLDAKTQPRGRTVSVNAHYSAGTPAKQSGGQQSATIRCMESFALRISRRWFLGSALTAAGLLAEGPKGTTYPSVWRRYSDELTELDVFRLTDPAFSS